MNTEEQLQWQLSKFGRIRLAVEAVAARIWCRRKNIQDKSEAVDGAVKLGCRSLRKIPTVSVDIVTIKLGDALQKFQDVSVRSYIASVVKYRV